MKVCDEGKKCVRYFLCQNSSIVTDGKGIIDPRFDEFITKPANTCDTLNLCCAKAGYVKPPKNLCKDYFKTDLKCGRRNVEGIGGEVRSMDNKTLYAQFAEFPWTMAIYKEIEVGNVDEEGFEQSGEKNIELKYHCGGSLIHPKVVLTTVHNLQRLTLSKIIVRGGEWDRQSTNEMCLHVDRRVAKIRRHKAFDLETFENDIALLILYEAFELTPFINTICLPIRSMSFDNSLCVSSGWSKSMINREEPYQNFLKRVDLKVVPNDQCEEKLLPHVEEGYKLSSSMICAGKLTVVLIT